MKEILLIRHGKSSWEFDLPDHKRPLKSRGYNDVELVAEALKSHGFVPDKIFSSSAVRAYETSKIMVKITYFNQFGIEKRDDLYDFSGENVISFIKSLENDINRIIIFGHNHALTSISNIFGNRYVDNVPTSGLVHLKFDCSHWKELSKGQTVKTIFPRDLK